MNSTALLAHQRMLEMLADRIRTHFQPEPNTVGRSYGRELPETIIEEFIRLREAGKTQREVIRILRIGHGTYTRIQYEVKRRTVK